MARRSSFAAARCLRAVCILGFLLTIAAAAFAAAGGPADNGSGASQTSISTAPPNSSKSAPKSVTKPLWADLTPAQRQALAPLATEWDTMGDIRKKKWLEIGNKFSTMKPDEQRRMQERIRDWAKLTPEQRHIARESYARAKKLNRDQKSAHWQQYQQLPEEQKKKLAADAASKKHVANLPPTQSKNKTVPPIKSTPKRVLEKSVTPQVASEPVSHPAIDATGK